MCDTSRSLPAFARRDDAVSPVVGSILNLTIAVAAIVVVMSWGIPTLQSAEADASLHSMIDQLDVTDRLMERVATSGGEVSADAGFTLARGRLRIDPVGDRWLISYGIGSDPANIRLSGLDDTDSRYRVHNLGSSKLTDVSGRHARVAGGEAGFERLGQTKEETIEADGSVQFQLQEGGGFVDIERTVQRIRFYQEGVAPSNLVAEAWVIDSAALRYELPSPAGMRQASLANSIVAVDSPDGSWVEGIDNVAHFVPETGSNPHLFISTERIETDTGDVVGPGSWQVKIRSRIHSSLTRPAPVVEHVRIDVRADDPGFWRRWIDLEVSAFEETDRDVYLRGPVKLSMFYHEVEFPTGFAER